MVSALKDVCAFHRPEICNVLDHADLAIGALIRAANVTNIGGADVATIETFLGGFCNRLHHIGQWGEQ